MIWDFIQTNPISKYSAYLDWNIADKSECLHCIESRLKMKLKNSNCWIIVDLNIPYHVLTKVWSDIDQIFDHQILLSKFTNTGGPLIVLKNGSIFFGKPYYENTNKIAVLWEELEILLNKHKPYYREICTMRGRTMRGPPVINCFTIEDGQGRQTCIFDKNLFMVWHSNTVSEH